jgi:hypothetical protein
MMEAVNLRSIVSTYVNITMYSPVELLYANKITKKRKLINLITILHGIPKYHKFY